MANKAIKIYKLYFSHSCMKSTPAPCAIYMIYNTCLMLSYKIFFFIFIFLSFINHFSLDSMAFKNITEHSCNMFQIANFVWENEKLLSSDTFKYKKCKLYIVISDYFYPCLSHVIHPQWSVKPKLRVQSFSSYPELTHEVRKGGDTVPQFGVFLLSQWHSGEARGTVWSHDARQAKEHLCTYAAPALKQTEEMNLQHLL